MTLIQSPVLCVAGKCVLQLLRDVSLISLNYDKSPPVGNGIE